MKRKRKVSLFHDNDKDGEQSSFGPNILIPVNKVNAKLERLFASLENLHNGDFGSLEDDVRKVSDEWIKIRPEEKK